MIALRPLSTAALFFLCSACSGVRANTIYFVTSDLPAGGEGGIYQVHDLNGDGDALDIGENVLWGRGLAQPADIRRFGVDGIMAADPSAGELVLFRDTNGDGDALDIGESTTWANGLHGVFGFDVADDRVLAADSIADTVVGSIEGIVRDADTVEIVH